MNSALLLVFLLFIPAQGQFQVIGSPEPVIAAVGDDVILPCHLEPRRDVTDMTVEWTRPDLPPDPADLLDTRPYVHVYRGGQEDVLMKNELYRDRTLLFRDELKHGNISLKLANVTFDDAGTYQCFIPKLTSNRRESMFQLVVVESSTPTPESRTTEETKMRSDEREEADDEGHRPTGHIWIPAVIVVVSVSLTGATYLLMRNIKRKKEKTEIQHVKMML